MHAFLSNLANRQTDERTRANAFTSSFVGGNDYLQIRTINSDQERKHTLRSRDMLRSRRKQWLN